MLPAHANLREVWGDAPAWVGLGGRARVDNVFDGAEPALEELTATLLRLVGQPEHARRVGAACARRAADLALLWREVGRSWRALVTRVLAGQDLLASHGPPRLSSHR